MRRRERELSPRYRAYIASPKWAWKRWAKLQQVGGKCEMCGTRDELEVHHKTYERFGRERGEDLQVLCAICHDIYHGELGNILDGFFNPKRLEAHDAETPVD